MDNRVYQSEKVRQWCEAHGVCEHGRDLAANCGDMRTVWLRVDRPAWLMWMVEQAEEASGVSFASAITVWNDMNAKYAHPCNEPPFQLDDFNRVDRDACAYLRGNIRCPFPITDDTDPPAEPQAPEPQAPEPQGPTDTQGPIRVASMMAVDKEYLRDLIEGAEYAEETARHYRRLAKFILAGVAIGIYVAVLAAMSVRHEDQGEDE